MVRDAAVSTYAILDKIAVTPMGSQDQLYQKAIEGFLTSLDRLGEAQTPRSPNCPSTDFHEFQENEAFPSPQSAASLNDRESQMLEEAMADIEQMMQQNPPQEP
ncbi:hypothetical protein [Leptolyngbya ohadii]|uniref:hypothetical protein n=1 Tax=Leptolyngbya ohadii TaxID=1962290 RepID=UPI000B59ED18|nr:hypothetical protein [Leptolyngbya ohadii]